MDELPNELPDLSSFSHEQKDALIRLLFPLIAEVRRLSARVAELKARLSKDSHNSSKPPSSDGLAKKSASPSVPSGKKPGGQPGRVGKTLERSVRVDMLVPYRTDASPRKLGGTWTGKVKIADDFDVLPPELAEAFYSKSAR